LPRPGGIAGSREPHPARAGVDRRADGEPELGAQPREPPRPREPERGVATGGPREQSPRERGSAAAGAVGELASACPVKAIEDREIAAGAAVDDVRRAVPRSHHVGRGPAVERVLPAAADKPIRPAGEWNTSRIVVRGPRVEHWLNGKHVLTYELGSAAVRAGIEKSKFKGHPGFGDKIVGQIMLTYHQDECWYRNLKIRETK